MDRIKDADHRAARRPLGNRPEAREAGWSMATERCSGSRIYSQTGTGDIALADPIQPREPRSAWRLFWISLPFVAAIVVLLAMAETATGWGRIGAYIWAGGAGGLWSVALIGNLVYSVVRYGWRRSVLAVLAAVPAVSFLGWAAYGALFT